jgi:hypothetical protein
MIRFNTKTAIILHGSFIIGAKNIRLGLSTVLNNFCREFHHHALGGDEVALIGML